MSEEPVDVDLFDEISEEENEELFIQLKEIGNEMEKRINDFKFSRSITMCQICGQAVDIDYATPEEIKHHANNFHLKYPRN